MIWENMQFIRYEILIAVFVTALISMIVSSFKRSRRNFPPGPWGFPIVGYFPFLIKNAHLHLTNLSKKYGNVFSIRLGSEMVVILNDSASIKEAYSKQEFTGRSPNSFFSVFSKKKPFRMNDLNLWQENRKFLIQSLKDLGKAEEYYQAEIKDFQGVLKSFNGEPINFDSEVAPSLSKNVSSFLFGKTHAHQEKEQKIFVGNFEVIKDMLAKDDLLTYFPWMKNVPFLLNWFSLGKKYELYNKSEEIFRKRVEEHKKTLDENNIRDFIDNYLVQIEKNQEKNVKSSIIEEALFSVSIGHFVASDASTRPSVGWIFHRMAGHPDVQKKVQEEILEVVGPDRSPEFQDMKSMPYTQATLMEIMRIDTVVALNTLRYTLSDTTLAGYDIPKGTLLMANFWASHHDPKNWKDPEIFRPERFLTSDGKNIETSPHHMPFSVGKRNCPGERVAYMELFLYFSSILQRFDVRYPEGYKPTFKGIYINTYETPPVKIRFLPKVV